MRRFEIVSKYQNLDIKIPVRATSYSAGYDLAVIKDYVIKPNEIVLVETGLRVLMPKHEAMLVFPRSSLGIKKGLMMSNSVGVIDSDYYDADNEGHIMIPLMNIRNTEVIVKKGERVAQGIFINYLKTTNEDNINDNIQRLGGFGSSGL